MINTAVHCTEGSSQAEGSMHCGVLFSRNLAAGLEDICMFLFRNFAAGLEVTCKCGIFAEYFF